MLHKLLRSAAAVSAIALWSSTVSATSIGFEITGGSAKATGFAEGTTVTIDTNDELEQAFTLGVGESKTVKFLDISVSGNGGALGVIEAALQFSDPIVGGAKGLLVGLGVILDDFGFGGVAVLDNPGPIAFGDGGLFGVTFNGFSRTCYGCSALSGTVTASIALLKAPHSVPEPTTLTLLGAGLAAFAFGARRARKAQPS